MQMTVHKLYPLVELELYVGYFRLPIPKHRHRERGELYSEIILPSHKEAHVPMENMCH
jgi:hypothetical protein